MDNSKDGAIRARAYQLWVESGHADGSQDQHWRQAEREIAAQSQAAEVDAGPLAPPAAFPSDGRHVDGVSPHPSVLDPAPKR